MQNKKLTYDPMNQKNLAVQANPPLEQLPPGSPPRQYRDEPVIFDIDFMRRFNAMTPGEQADTIYQSDLDRRLVNSLDLKYGENKTEHTPQQIYHHIRSQGGSDSVAQTVKDYAMELRTNAIILSEQATMEADRLQSEAEIAHQAGNTEKAGEYIRLAEEQKEIAKSRMTGGKVFVSNVPVGTAIWEGMLGWPSNALDVMVDTIESPKHIMMALQYEMTKPEGGRSLINEIADWFAYTYDVRSPAGRQAFIRYIRDNPAEFTADVAAIVNFGKAAASAPSKLGMTGKFARAGKWLHANEHLKAGLAFADPVEGMSGELLRGVEVGLGLHEPTEYQKLERRINDRLGDDAVTDVRLPYSHLYDIDNPDRIDSRIGGAYKVAPTGFTRRWYQGLKRSLIDASEVEAAKFNKTGEKITHTRLTNLVSDGIDGYKQIFETEMNDFFTQRFGPDFTDAPARWQNTLDTAKEIIAQNTGAFSDDADIARLKKLMAKLIADNGNAVDPMTIGRMMHERTRYRQIEKLGQVGTGGDATLPQNDIFKLKLYNAITSDIILGAMDLDKKIGGNSALDIKTFWDLYRQGMEKLNHDAVRTVVRHIEKSRPESVADALIRSNILNKQSLADGLFEVLQPEAANAVRSYYLESVLRKARTTAEGGGTEVFTTHGLAKQLKDPNTVETIKAVLGEDVYDALDNIAKAMLTTENIQKAVGGSQTSWNLFALTRAGGVGGGAGAVGELLATGSLSYSSPDLIIYPALGLAAIVGDDMYRALRNNLRVNTSWGTELPPLKVVKAVLSGVRKSHALSAMRHVSTRIEKTIPKAEDDN